MQQNNTEFSIKSSLYIIGNYRRLAFIQKLYIFD